MSAQKSKLSEMKKHLETNYRLPLLILVLLIVATLLASFYAGSQTAGVFHFSPRAFFEGPFLGIGIGDLPGILQPGFHQNEQTQTSTEPKLCLVCNENGYCENDIFSSARSSCVYTNDSIEQRAACNEACARRTHDSNGSKIALLTLSSTCNYGGESGDTYRCSPAGNYKKKIQECKPCSGNECTPNSPGYWSNTDITCDEAKGETCTTGKKDCDISANLECTINQDDKFNWDCFGGKQYHCVKGSGPAPKPQWEKIDCPESRPLCDPTTHECVATLTDCPEDKWGDTQCVPATPDGVVVATTCKSGGKGIDQKVCGLGETCKPGKEGGCKPLVAGLTCDHSIAKDICSGDRKSVLTCPQEGVYQTKNPCPGGEANLCLWRC